MVLRNDLNCNFLFLVKSQYFHASYGVILRFKMKTNFLILTCFSLSYRYLDAEVKLVDNGYEGIILTIADHVKQDTALLVKIQVSIIIFY